MFADDLPKSDSAETKVKDGLVRINEGRKRFIEMKLSHKFTTKANGNPASFPKKIIQRINLAINFNDVKHSRFSIWFRSYVLCGLSAASLNRIGGKNDSTWFDLHGIKNRKGNSMFVDQIDEEDSRLERDCPREVRGGGFTDFVSGYP